MPNADLTSYVGIYGSTIPTGGLGQLYGCLPQVGEGSASFERDGLKISPVKHRTDLRFVFNDDALITGSVPASKAGWDITVHVWYGTVRRFKNITDATDPTLANEILVNILDNGEGITLPFQGRLAEETLAQNKEFVTLKHKQFRMYKNAGLANVLDTVSPSLGTPMILEKRLSLSFKPPKVLQYKDEDQLFPENYAPFMIVGYCHNDGTQAANALYNPLAPSILNIPAVKMYQADKLWFKDH